MLYFEHYMFVNDPNLLSHRLSSSPLAHKAAVADVAGDYSDKTRAETAVDSSTIQTQVLIIGGGATGTGLARDLALRGVNCLLAEKADINAGASGANHGLLHSGARYVASDPNAARECVSERNILKRLAPQCVEETGGLFVAAPGDDEKYIAGFSEMCARCGLWVRELDTAQALEMEPALSPDIIAAFEVQEGNVDPFMLSLDNLAQARALGAKARRNWRAVEMLRDRGKIRKVAFWDSTRQRRVEVEAELVINAAGAWSGLVAGLAGLRLDILYSKGTLLVTQERLAHRVINRLRVPSDADILVPGGTVSVLGTTSRRIKTLDGCGPTVAEVDQIIDDAKAMVPVLDKVRYIRAYAGVRPLVACGGGGDDRRVSRDLTLLDHSRDGVDNFITITGGKLTTYRLMAEKAADLACRKLGVDAPCLTRSEPLPASGMGRWSQPLASPKLWLEKRAPDDLVLCECEMVSQKTVDELLEGMDGMGGRNLLRALGLRSRLGKGPCQGGFCGLRTTAHLYDRGEFEGRAGLEQLKSFIERRWRGYAPVQWGNAMEQAELQDSLYCGLLDLELSPAEPS